MTITIEITNNDKLVDRFYLSKENQIKLEVLLELTNIPAKDFVQDAFRLQIATVAEKLQTDQFIKYLDKVKELIDKENKESEELDLRIDKETYQILSTISNERKVPIDVIINEALSASLVNK